MVKKIFKILTVVIIVFAIILGIMYLIDKNRMDNNKPVFFSTWGAKYTPPKEVGNLKFNSNIQIVTSLEDEITDNSAWCGTFNLIWNDLKNDLAKQDIVFNPQLDVVTNLNKGTFNTSYLSEDSYYKVYGTPSMELKTQIEKAIKDKFNETSNILDDFDWENCTEKDYLLYAMLKKEFEFPKEFTELENGKFGNYDNVKYFGINKDTDDEVRNQVEVLYYYTEDDFAIKLITKTNDEVILAKGINANTFGKVYEEIKAKNNEQKHTSLYSSQIRSDEEVKIPNISFNLKEEFEELENKYFEFSNGDSYKIRKALQTIQFDINKKGGKIKSEAGMMVDNLCVTMEDRTDPRNFNLDDTFVIFLKEKEKDLPYFAAKISDISSVQSDTENIL